MDCEQVQELLDAYALGAADGGEAAALEAHVADCVRCWTSLNEAQRTAAAIALSAALERAPRPLRERVLAATIGSRRSAASAGTPSFLRRLLPAGAVLATAGAAAALTFAFILQAQVNDLEADKDELAAQIQAAGERIDEQQQVVALLAAPDAQNVSLAPTNASDPSLDATAVLHWSEGSDIAVLICDGLPDLDEGEVYKVWLITDEGTQPVADFRSWRGGGQVSMSMKSVETPPVGVGLSVEDAAEAEEPSAMILWASLER